jgi:hypothetical protein
MIGPIPIAATTAADPGYVTAEPDRSAQAVMPQQPFSYSGTLHEDAALSLGGTSNGGQVDAPPDLEDLLQTREAARELARKALGPHAEALASEKMALVQKQYVEGLTVGEVARLAYVRWQLDRLDDATIGADLDRLDGLVQVQETLAATVGGYVQEIRDLARSAGHTTVRRRR